MLVISTTVNLMAKANLLTTTASSSRANFIMAKEWPDNSSPTTVSSEDINLKNPRFKMATVNGNKGTSSMLEGSETINYKDTEESTLPTGVLSKVSGKRVITKSSPKFSKSLKVKLCKLRRSINNSSIKWIKTTKWAPEVKTYQW